MNWKTHLKRMNQKVDDDNRKALVKGNVRYRNVCLFFSNEILKNIGCLVSALTFDIEGSSLWNKEEDINLSGKKRKRHSFWIKFYL